MTDADGTYPLDAVPEMLQLLMRGSNGHGARTEKPVLCRGCVALPRALSRRWHRTVEHKIPISIWA